MTPIQIVDSIIQPGRFDPRWGFHDDHRERDGKPGYLPALMQVRSEFEVLLSVLQGFDIFKGRALQLGVGECDASHEVWRALFGMGAVTIDFNGLYVDGERREGGNTHQMEMQIAATFFGPYDFLFIDAGHTFEDVRQDHLDYAPMVRSGGIIAFHDSLPRAAYPEVEVWKYLASINWEPKVNQIGTEVGIGWTVKP
jgi:hypothetical protein